MEGPDSSNSLGSNSLCENEAYSDQPAKGAQPDSTEENSKNNSQEGQRAKDSDSHLREVCEHLASRNSRDLAGGESLGRASALGLGVGNQYFKNTILDEVLSEKKMALLHSPDVMQFLQQKMKSENS